MHSRRPQGQIYILPSPLVCTFLDILIAVSKISLSPTTHSGKLERLVNNKSQNMWHKALIAQLQYHAGNCWDTLRYTTEKLNSLKNGRDSIREPQEQVITCRFNQFSWSNVFFPFKKRFNNSHAFFRVP